MNRVSPTFAAALADGLYLSVCPVVGALLPPLVFLLGCYLGWGRIGYSPADGLDFMYSFTTVLLFILVSQHGGALGCWLWLGFALGDLLLNAPPLSAFFAQGVVSLWTVTATRIAPRALADAVLATLLIFIPLATATLTQSAVRGLQSYAARRSAADQRRGVKLLLAVLIRAAINFIVVYLWLKAASVMLQGVYIWSGVGPTTHGLVQQWILDGLIAAVVAAYAAGVRSALVLRAQSRLAPRLGELRNAMRGRAPMTNPRIAVPVRAAFLTFVCGTFIDTWTSALVLFVVFLAIFAAREMLQIYATGWSRLLWRTPAFVRAGVAFLLVYFGAKVVTSATAAATTFYPAELAAVLSLIVFIIALPRPTKKEA